MFWKFPVQAAPTAFSVSHLLVHIVNSRALRRLFEKHPLLSATLDSCHPDPILVASYNMLRLLCETSDYQGSV